MTLSKGSQIKKEDRKRRRADKHWQRYIENLRHQMQQERDRRRKWLLVLLLTLLESKPAQMFFPVYFSEADPPQQKRQPKPVRKSRKKKGGFDQRDDPRTEYDRLYLSDCSTRYGEEHLEVYDGLTHEDIVAYNREYRPWLFPKFEPIPGMPSRYAHEPVHIWTLFEHVDSDYHRPQALEALKLIVDESSHDWVDACAKEVGGLTYKDLRRQCRRRTPDQTLLEFPRAAARWREARRSEAEERKKEIKETPDSGPKPSGLG